MIKLPLTVARCSSQLMEDVSPGLLSGGDPGMPHIQHLTSTTEHGGNDSGVAEQQPGLRLGEPHAAQHAQSGTVI